MRNDYIMGSIAWSTIDDSQLFIFSLGTYFSGIFVLLFNCRSIGFEAFLYLDPTVLWRFPLNTRQFQLPLFVVSVNIYSILMIMYFMYVWKGRGTHIEWFYILVAIIIYIRTAFNLFYKEYIKNWKVFFVGVYSGVIVTFILIVGHICFMVCVG